MKVFVVGINRHPIVKQPLVKFFHPRFRPLFIRFSGIPSAVTIIGNVIEMICQMTVQLGRQILKGLKQFHTITLYRSNRRCQALTFNIINDTTKENRSVRDINSVLLEEALQLFDTVPSVGGILADSITP